MKKLAILFLYLFVLSCGISIVCAFDNPADTCMIQDLMLKDGQHGDVDAVDNEENEQNDLGSSCQNNETDNGNNDYESVKGYDHYENFHKNLVEIVNDISKNTTKTESPYDVNGITSTSKSDLKSNADNTDLETDSDAVYTNLLKENMDPKTNKLTDDAIYKLLIRLHKNHNDEKTKEIAYRILHKNNFNISKEKIDCYFEEIKVKKKAPNYAKYDFSKKNF